jgi:hypothetical protein
MVDHPLSRRVTIGETPRPQDTSVSLWAYRRGDADGAYESLSTQAPYRRADQSSIHIARQVDYAPHVIRRDCRAGIEQ